MKAKNISKFERRLLSLFPKKTAALYIKWREYILYIFFGGLTTVVNFIFYFALKNAIGYLAANVVAWAASVLFAFVTNRIWVFNSKRRSIKAVFAEFIAFISSRLLSGGIETALLYIFVDLLAQSENIFKIIISVVVVILNYVFSKFFVFK